MTKTEFWHQGLLTIGAALVKVYDEKADGILDNDAAQQQLADTAADIVAKLVYEAEDNDAFFDDRKG